MHNSHESLPSFRVLQASSIYYRILTVESIRLHFLTHHSHIYPKHLLLGERTLPILDQNSLKFFVCISVTRTSSLHEEAYENFYYIFIWLLAHWVSHNTFCLFFNTLINTENPAKFYFPSEKKRKVKRNIVNL